MRRLQKSLGKASYAKKFDLLKGFWQVPLTERTKEISVFVTAEGLYQYKVMPFGMKNSLSTFQPFINKDITDLEDCETYIDDVIIFSDTWGKKTLRTTCEFFKRLSEAKLTINLSKSEFGRAQVTSLEHVVGQSQVKPVSVKVEAITTFPQAESKKEVMRLVSMAGHCRRLCSNFATVTEPLTQLFSKKERNLFERCLRN